MWGVISTKHSPAISTSHPWCVSMKVPGHSSSAISPRSCSFNSSVPLTWARARSCNGIMIMWGKRDRAGGKGEAAVKAHPAPAVTHGRLKKSKSPGIVAVRWYLGKQDCFLSHNLLTLLCVVLLGCHAAALHLSGFFPRIHLPPGSPKMEEAVPSQWAFVSGQTF